VWRAVLLLLLAVCDTTSGSILVSHTRDVSVMASACRRSAGARAWCAWQHAIKNAHPKKMTFATPKAGAV
jgi:hypothetical protein